MKLIFYLLKCVVILIYLHTIFLEANAVTKLKNKMEVQGNLFIDIGANLTDRMFDGVYSKKKHANDLQHVLNRAKKNNVEKIIITCTCLEDIDKSLKICETYDPEGKFLFLTAGVHPTNCYEFIDKNIMEEKDKQAKREFEEFINHFKNVKCAVAENPKRDDDNAKGHNANAADVQIKEEKKHSSETPQGDALKIPGFVYDKKEQDYLEKLKKKITNHSNRIVSIGEIGLDFDRLFFCPKYIQIKYFIYQLKLVQMFKLPIFLHMRNCSDIFFEILDKYKPLIEGVGGVIHSFTDREEIIEKINTYKNLYIGVNGCSLKTPENLSTVKRIPLNLLLLETDAPWCSIKKTHASYHFIQEKYEKRNYTNLKKIRNVIQCDDETIFKERNEPYNIV